MSLQNARINDKDDTSCSKLLSGVNKAKVEEAVKDESCAVDWRPQVVQWTGDHNYSIIHVEITHSE
jgi:hypothetical protein